MKLSIIIPVYNEEKTLAQALEQVFNLDLEHEKEIVVVNDASTDSSLNILKDLQDKFDLKIISHEKNMGKGAALRTGFKNIQGDMVIIHDADLEYNPNDWLKLISKFQSSDTNVIYGSRNIHPERRGKKTYAWGVAFLTGLINFLHRSKLTDAYTCVKLFDSSVIKNLNLQSNNFDIEVEMTIKLLKNKNKILELPVSYNPRTHKEGKKIGFKDGVSGLISILKHTLKK